MVQWSEYHHATDGPQGCVHIYGIRLYHGTLTNVDSLSGLYIAVGLDQRVLYLSVQTQPSPAGLDLDQYNS